MAEKRGWWTQQLLMAAAVLHDRPARRRALLSFVALLLGMFAAGLWLIDGWITASVWRFLFWWGACGLLSVFVFLFAVYDLLAVIREERERFFGRRHGDGPGESDSPCDDDD